MVKKTVIWLIVFALLCLAPVIVDAAKDKPASREAQKKMKEAEKALKGNNQEKAEMLFLEIIEIEPDFAPSYFGLAAIQKKRNQIDDALDSMSRGLALRPDQAVLQNFNEILFRESGKLMQSGKSAKANDYLLKLLNHPQNKGLKDDLLIDINYKVAVNYFNLRQYENALEFMNKVESMSKDQPSFLEYYANSVYMNGIIHGALKNVGEANKYLRQFITLKTENPDNTYLPLANYFLASINFEALKEATDKLDKQLEDINKEIDKLNQNTKIRPREREAKAKEMKERIDAVKKEKIETAKSEYDNIMPYVVNALELNDELLDAHVIKGNYQYLCHDLEAALETYKNLVAKFPNAEDINAYKSFLKDIEKEKTAENK